MMAGHALPRITLILPTKDRKEQFARVLEEVLRDKRDYPDLEIVVVDGGTGDARVEDVVAAHAADVAWYGPGEGRGIYGALDTGLRHATGAYVRVVSDDDGYVTGSTRAFARRMRDYPNHAAIGGTATYVRVDDDGTETPFDTGSRTGMLSIRDYVHSDSMVLCVHEALYFRRDLLQRLGGWNDRYLVSGDLDLVFRLLRCGRTIRIFPDTVMHARRSTGSMSRRHSVRALAEPLLSLFLTGHWLVLGAQLLRMVMRRLGGR
jgi:glycosyltransferase involved in cell wall biosynthesis